LREGSWREDSWARRETNASEPLSKLHCLHARTPLLQNTCSTRSAGTAGSWPADSSLQHHPTHGFDAIPAGSLEAGIGVPRVSFSAMPTALEDTVSHGCSARALAGGGGASEQRRDGAASWRRQNSCASRVSLPHGLMVVMRALPRRLVEGIMAMAALLHRLLDGVLDMAQLAHRLMEGVVVIVASTSSLAAVHSVGARESSKTRSSSEMERARARAFPWRTESVMVAVHAGHDGGSKMPFAVKTMSRQGITLADTMGDSACSCACVCLLADAMNDGIDSRRVGTSLGVDAGFREV
jgi:hypothetical protein